MRNIFKYLICAGALAALAASCAKEEQMLKPATLMKSVEITMADIDRARIYVDDKTAGTTTLPMVVGESITLGVTTDPSDLSELTHPEIIWTSSNEEVLTVDEYGTIKALAAGVATVTVEPATINLVASASIKVTVSAELHKVTTITISDDSTHKSEFSDLPSCYIGETMTLSATVEPEDATFKTVYWTSGDESIAVIDPVSGLVTGVTSGEVQMTASALDNSGVTANYSIFIDKIITPEGIRLLNAPSATDAFSVADKTFKLEYETWPEISTRSLINWTSSDTDIARVDYTGVVQILKYGDVDITATVPENDIDLEGYQKSVTVRFHIPAGFYREHFADKGNVSWVTATNGATVEWMTSELDEAYLWFTPAKTNSNTLRGDVKRSGSTYLSREYPILTFRIDDVNDLGYARNITLDTSGATEDGTKLSGGVGSTNNKWVKKYKCSDGSAILVYDLSKQGFGKSDGTNLLPEGTVGTFGTFQLKYADIRFSDKHDYPDDPGVHYRMFWFHSFTSMDELTTYLNQWSETTKITFE